MRLQEQLSQFWTRHQRAIHQADYAISSDISRSILLVESKDKQLRYIELYDPEDKITEIPFGSIEDVRFFTEITDETRKAYPNITQINTLIIHATDVQIQMSIVEYDWRKFREYFPWPPKQKPKPKRKPTAKSEAVEPATEGATENG